MKREIKFRAWDKANNEMFIVRTLEWDAAINPALPSNVTTIMQFTGLKDKHGTEIFEGDILSYRTEPVVVEYHTDMFHCRSTKYPNLSPGNYRLATLREVCEIIGNVFQNPELIGGQNELKG